MSIKTYSIGKGDAYNSMDDFIDDGSLSSDEDYKPSSLGDSEDVGGYPLRNKKKRKFEDTDIEENWPDIKKVKGEKEKTTVIQPHTIIGRDDEVNRIMRMLGSSYSTRPLLIGPAGVGKRSIINKFAVSLKSETCPEFFKDRVVVQIDCKELVATAQSYCGGNNESQYFLSLVRRVQRSNLNPIFFFQDVDVLVSNQSTIPLIFQTFLQENHSVIATISSTETSEISKQAMATLGQYQFQVMNIEEPSKSETEKIVNEYVENESIFSELTLDPNALRLAIDLAGRYLKDQSYPTKVISLIAEVATSVLMLKESKTIEPDDVASTMADKISVPAEQLLTTDTHYLQRIYDSIRGQLVGQDKAVDTVYEAIKREKLNFRDRSKPWGVFLFVGPTGVGKTELAKIVARVLDCHFLRFDMGEFQEPHSLARLIGSPPGYVGHESGGGLTNELRKYPHSVVLFDEMEKAHPDVANTLLHVFDDGRITDGLGMTVECNEAIFIMTSNLGAKTLFSGKRKVSSNKDLMEQVLPLIEEQWSPEFLGRLTEVIPFESLSNKDYPQVVKVHLNQLAGEILEYHNMKLIWSTKVIPYLLKKHGDEMRSGIRGLCKKVKEDVYNALANAKHNGKIYKKMQVTLDVQKDALVVRGRKLR